MPVFDALYNCFAPIILNYPDKHVFKKQLNLNIFNKIKNTKYILEVRPPKYFNGRYKNSKKLHNFPKGV
jgi:hypothetical protein